MNAHTLTAWFSVDPALDRVGDLRDTLHRYQSWLVAHRPREALAPFTAQIIGADRFSKKSVEKIERIIAEYVRSIPIHVASFLPNHQEHLVDRLPHKHYSIEFLLHHRYSKHDMGDDLPSRRVKQLPISERIHWHPEGSIYMDTHKSTRTKLVVQMDLLYLMRNLVHPIFLAPATERFNPSVKFLRDISHEWEHFLRKEHMDRVIEEETRFQELPESAQYRDFLVRDLASLIVEEGIGNKAVWSAFPFYYTGRTIERFRAKAERYLRMHDWGQYLQDHLYIESYEKDGAGIYYAGEAATYVIDFLFAHRKGIAPPGISYKQSAVSASNLREALRDQRVSDHPAPILLSPDQNSFVRCYRHMHGLTPKRFFEELYDAQDYLRIRAQDRPFPRDFLDDLEKRGATLPLEKHPGATLESRASRT